MEDRRLGAATARLVGAIEGDGTEGVAHGKADDEFACKYRMILRRDIVARLVRVGTPKRLRVSAEIGRDARVVQHASREHKGALCSPSMPMPALLERLASNLLLSIPDPLFDTATPTPRLAKDVGKLTL